jgi:hypothetical protein
MPGPEKHCRKLERKQGLHCLICDSKSETQLSKGISKLKPKTAKKEKADLVAQSSSYEDDLVSIRFSENGQNLPCWFSSPEYSGEKSVLKEERIKCQKHKILFRKICVGAQIAKLFIRRKCVKLCQKG